jgi:hypothetical protein
MQTLPALGGGLAGACTLTLLHEITRRIDPEAPRMDKIGIKAVDKGLKSARLNVPGKDKLFNWALAGDLIGNALYFSSAGTGSKKQVWQKAALLGLSAGLGAILLPKPLGLDGEAVNQSPRAKAITLGLYIVGGLVTAATINLLNKKTNKKLLKSR